MCVCVSMLVAQLYPTLCNPMDCSLPGFSVHEILQARIVEWIAIPFSMASSWARGQTQVSRTTGSTVSEPPEKCVCVCVCVCVCAWITYLLWKRT